MTRVLIAGCGDVGTRLGLLLTADGKTVFGLRRDPSGLPATFTSIAGDLTHASTLKSLPGAVDALVYCAAAGRRDAARYEQVYLRGLENVLSALPDTPSRVVFVSSTSVYGQDAGEWIDEDSPADANTGAAGWLRAAEARALAADGIATVVRFSGIYGPGRLTLVNSVRQGNPVQEDPPWYTNRIHADDAASVLKHVLDRPAPLRLYLASDNDPCPQAEIADWLADRLHLKPPPRKAAGGASRNKRCRNTRLLEDGFRFRFPSYREGYTSILAH